jgi:hypothetical protein
MNKFIYGFLITGLISSYSYASKDDHKHEGHNHDSLEHDGHKGKDKDDHGHYEEKHEGHDHASPKHDDHKDKDDHGHGHGGGKAIGIGKAIEEIDEIKGFKLSKEAIITLSIEFKDVDTSEFLISKSTLVASKGIKGIYRFREGYFKFLHIKLKKEIKGQYLIHVNEIGLGDQIVTGGVNLLRVSDIYSTDTSEYGHSH